MAKQFHILVRNPAGGLTAATKKYVKEAGVDLEFKTAKTASAATVLSEFRDALPKSVTIPDASPFLILRTGRPGGIGPVAACKCQCSLTSDCGGGGGGS